MVVSNLGRGVMVMMTNRGAPRRPAPQLLQVENIPRVSGRPRRPRGTGPGTSRVGITAGTDYLNESVEISGGDYGMWLIKEEIAVH